MNVIHIKELKIPATIGVNAFERTIKQDIVVNLEIMLDMDRAAEEDNIDHTIDYAKICQHIKQFITQSSYQLVETLGKKLVESLTHTFNMTHFKLTLTKKPLDIPELDGVSIVIERQAMSE